MLLSGIFSSAWVEPAAHHDLRQMGPQVVSNEIGTYVGVCIVQIYSDLDVKLQTEFTAYLEERKVNKELGGYLLVLAEDKEQREYMRWLGTVSDFVSK